ncbi:MAG: alpha-E domain-containing protein [Agitococcus sp.]|nr:alpha-E domain-containing protein [Agitococcus sp.]
MLLLSTAADLYWLGRYFSRSQELVDLLLTSIKDSTLEGLGIPLSITGTWQNFYQQYATLSSEALAEFFITANNPTSLTACLEATRADAQATRGRISAELWVAINSLWLEWQERVTQVGTYAEHLASYEWLKQSLQAVQMLITDNSDAEAQRFISIGQSVEALDNAFRKLATPDAITPLNTDIAQWAAILLQHISDLDKSSWQQTMQLSTELVQVCQLSVDDGAMMNMQDVQMTLQRLTHSLADVFAA